MPYASMAGCRAAFTCASSERKGGRLRRHAGMQGRTCSVSAEAEVVGSSCGLSTRLHVACLRRRA